MNFIRELTFVNRNCERSVVLVLWDCAESNKTSNSLASKLANRCFFLYRFVLDFVIGIQHFWTYSSCSSHWNAVTNARDYDNFFVFLSSYRNTTLNQSARVFSLGYFLKRFRKHDGSFYDKKSVIPFILHKSVSGQKILANVVKTVMS